MARHRSSRSSRLAAALVVALLGSVLCSLLVVHSATGSTSAAAARFERPSAKTVRTEAKDILSQPRFTPRESPLTRFLQWLKDKLSSLRLPHFGGTVGRVVWWIIVVCCVLTLLAVVAHLVWNLVTYVRGARGPAHGLKGPYFERLRDRSFKDLRQLMLDHAQKGEFREAIGVMMVALLRWLDDADIFTFHQSKTNGDYVREYPRQRSSRDEFRRFALGFDGTIYGGAACDRAAYMRMNDMFERVLDHAAKEP